MAEKQFLTKKTGIGQDVTLLKKYKVGEILDLDDADTITVPGLTTIDSAKVIDLVNGNDISVNISGDVITVNDIAALNKHVIVLVVGV